MADLRLRVGGATATYTFAGTEQQAAAALTRYARSLGIPVTGVANDDLLAVVMHFIDDIKRRSKAVQVSDGLAAAQVTIQQQAETDNTL